MDVIVIFKAMSKCRDFYRLEVNEFANDCKTAFKKKKKGRRPVIPPPDRIYLHVYKQKLLALQSVIYNLKSYKKKKKKKTQRQESSRSPIE